MQGMKLPDNPLSIEDGWNGLAIKAPYIVCNIANHLDFVSYYRFRRVCHATYAGVNPNTLSEIQSKGLLAAVKDMDADAYTKAMVFFSENSAMKQLIYKNVGPDTSEVCPYETQAIGYLLSLNEGLSQKSLLENPEWLVSWYEKVQQEKIFEVYKNDLQSWTSLNYGCAAIIRLILHQKGDVNWQDEHGNTLLHYAKHLAHVQFLLGIGADPNKQNNKGETPLHYAIAHPGIRMVKHSITQKWCWDYAWRLAIALLDDTRTNFSIETNAKKTVVDYVINDDLHVKNAKNIIKALPLQFHCEWVDFSKIMVDRESFFLGFEYMAGKLCDKMGYKEKEKQEMLTQLRDKMRCADAKQSDATDKQSDTADEQSDVATTVVSSKQSPSYLHSWISIVYKHPEIAFFSGITLAGLLGWLLYKSRT